MSKISILTQLILFFVFALTVSLWQLRPLFVLVLVLLLVMAWGGDDHFYRLMKRLKWFYFVMLLIYAFNTPGEHVVNWPFNAFHPTYEGLYGGVVQVLRITAMLQAISLLMVANSKQALISGFYFLALPLKWIGLDAERFAARLWLTLHYVELRQLNKETIDIRSTLPQYLLETFQDSVDEDVEISFEKPVLAVLDYILLVLMLVVVGYFLGVYK
jgi:energy-coupling factor transport system permease protein